MAGGNELMYLDNLQESLEEGKRIVTYKWLSHTLRVPANVAKRMIYTYWSQRKTRECSNMLITFCVSGILRASTIRCVSVALVKGEVNLEECKSHFSEVWSTHAYSLQMADSEVSLLHAIDSTLTSDQLMLYSSLSEVSLVSAPKYTVQADKKTAQADKKTAQADKKTAQADKKTAHADKKTVQPDKKTAQADKKTVQPDKKTAQADKKTAQANKMAALSDKKTVQPDKKTVQPDKKTVQPDKKTAQANKMAVLPNKMAALSDKKTAQADKTVQTDKKNAQSDKTTAQTDKKTAQLDNKIVISTNRKIVVENELLFPEPPKLSYSKLKFPSVVDCGLSTLEKDVPPREVPSHSKPNPHVKEKSIAQEESTKESQGDSLFKVERMQGELERKRRRKIAFDSDTESDNDKSTGVVTTDKKYRKRVKRLKSRMYTTSDGSMVTEKYYESDSTDASEKDEPPEIVSNLHTAELSHPTGKAKRKNTAKQKAITSFFNKK